MTDDLERMKKRVDQLENEIRLVLSGRPMADVMVAMIKMLAEAINMTMEPEGTLKQAIEHLSDLVVIRTEKLPPMNKEKMN